MKKTLMLFVAVAMVFCTVLTSTPVFAAALSQSSPTAATPKVRIWDTAEIFSKEEETALQTRMAELLEKHSCDLAVYTVNSKSDKSAKEIAEAFYADKKLGGKNGGVLLFINMATAEAYMNVSADATNYFGDERISLILKDILPFLAKGDYSGAIGQFLTKCDEILTAAPPVTEENSTVTPAPPKKPKERKLTWQLVTIAVAVGGIVSALYCKRKAEEFATEPEPYEYDCMRGSRVKIHVKEDNQLERTTFSRRVPKDGEEQEEK